MVDQPAPIFIRLAGVAQVFTPAAPIDDAELFAERPEQVMACLTALFQKGLHVALYGERGVGKTSLAKVLPQLIQGTALDDLDTVRIDCNTNDDYRSIWRKVFRELGREAATDPPIEELQAPDPEDVRYRLQGLDHRTLIVIDELDRVDDDALSLMADTVMTLSDHSVDVTLMFVGVASSVESLLGEHESIVRSVAQVAVPRMPDNELESILNRGFDAVDLTSSDEARRRITQASEGLPHYTHLLGLHAAQTAIQEDRTKITPDDVARAESVAMSQHSIRSEYDQATASPQRDHIFEEVLLACAYTPKSEFGYFRAGEVREPLSQIVGRSINIANYSRNLNEMAKMARGPALKKEGETRNFTFRFRDPLLQPFVKMVGRAKGIIDTATERKLQGVQDAGSWWSARATGEPQGVRARDGHR